jgi:hypothetical protein
MPNAPNTPIQPTPLRGPEIVGVLQSGFVQMAVPIYNGGAADGQPVGRAISMPVVRYGVLNLCIRAGRCGARSHVLVRNTMTMR